MFAVCQGRLNMVKHGCRKIAAAKHLLIHGTAIEWHHAAKDNAHDCLQQLERWRNKTHWDSGKSTKRTYDHYDLK